MVGDMTPIDVLSRALAQTGDLLAKVHDDTLTWSTPCSEWDVAAVADHVIADAQNFGKMVRGERPDWATTPHVAQGWGVAFRVSADDLIQALREHESDEPFPAGMACAEFAVHDWDLATALGLALDGLDPAVAELGLEFMRANLTDANRGGGFGPEQPAPPDAGPYDAIAAYAGRRVATVA